MQGNTDEDHRDTRTQKQQRNSGINHENSYYDVLNFEIDYEENTQ